MPAPSTDWTLVPVRGTYKKLDGTAVKGKVIFTPRPGHFASVGQLTSILGNGFVATLNSQGAFTINLPASDDPDIAPGVFSYHVKEVWYGGREYDIVVPASAAIAGLDLAQVTPLETPLNATTTSVPGPKGDTGATGPQGPAGTAGAAGAQGPKGDTGDPGTVTSHGTGFPTGTPALGTEYVDDNATNGAVRWVYTDKGWTVSVGDTGERNVENLLQSLWVIRNTITLKRYGAQVTLNVRSIAGDPTNTSGDQLALILPDGFRPTSPTPEITAGEAPPAAVTLWIASAFPNGQVRWARFGAPSAIDYSYVSLTFTTADAWPATLPGTAYVG